MVDRSHMNREVHVWICEGLGVRFPWATRLLSPRQGYFYRPQHLVVVGFIKFGFFEDTVIISSVDQSL